MLSNTSCPSPCTRKKKAHHVTKKELLFFNPKVFGNKLSKLRPKNKI
jgi:hypothetical protein